MPCISSYKAMKRTLELALDPIRVDSFGWWIVAAEAGLIALFFFSGELAPVVIRGLQLFLRF